MTQALVDQIAAAVLYEGYVLYPYRPSLKNRQRWTFGAVYPKPYTDAEARGDACWMHVECLINVDSDTHIAIRVRFLHLTERLVGTLASTGTDPPADAEPAFRAVAALRVGDTLHQTWQEAEEREIDLGESELNHLVTHSLRRVFSFPAHRQLELLRDAAGNVGGRASAAAAVPPGRGRSLGRSGRRRRLQGGRAHPQRNRRIGRAAHEPRRRPGPRAAFDARHPARPRRSVRLPHGPARALAPPPPSAATSEPGRSWSASRASATRSWPSPIILPDYPSIAPRVPATSSTARRLTRSSPCAS